MVSKNPVQTISTWLSVSLLAGGLLWCIVLVQASKTMYTTHSRTETVRIGPFSLNKLTKDPLESGGYRVGISFADGSIPFVIMWSVLGFLLGTIIMNRTKQT